MVRRECKSTYLTFRRFCRNAGRGKRTSRDETPSACTAEFEYSTRKMLIKIVQNLFYQFINNFLKGSVKDAEWAKAAS